MRYLPMVLMGLVLGIGVFLLMRGENVMKLTSSEFTHNSPLTAKHAYRKCGGDNQSPALAWSEVPTGTKSFVLICDDPDAPGGTFVHWVIFNIPGEKRGLLNGMPQGEKLEQGMRQLHNDYGTDHVGYDGPCPPSGTHRYVFTLYALDTTLEAASRGKLHGEMKGHVLAQAQLIGKYAAQR